jgi:small subunit ribosomal protein S16
VRRQFMLIIRLARRGSKKHPQYRVVVSDSIYGKGGAIVENVGTYEPKSKDSRVNLKRDRIEFWISRGASVTDTVKSLIKNIPA